MNRVWILFALLIAIGVALSMLLTRHDNANPPPVPVAEDQLVTQVEITQVEPTFVGRDVCRECHAENYHLHDQHGHAHTFASTSDPDIAEKFAGRTYDTGEYGTFTYHASDEGLVARIPEKFGDQSFPLQYALGSGHNGITLLSLMPDHKKGTVGIEHRASWFHSGRLGPTPGQTHGTPETLSEIFGQRHVDLVMHKCVYCHITTGTIVDQEIVGLTPNVNCEKCHGPASEHVRQARASRTPPPFSVGRDDWDTEAEIQLCGDCHRLPRAIEREQLREYPDSLSRFQPVGLLRSKCFVESDGRLKCTTCHNPHTTNSAVASEVHVQNCVNCHLEDSEAHVACPVSPKDGCIDCHMPELAFPDLETGFHDHWIRVRDDE